ncbi:hypothetical protein [Micromonospora sp. NPDC048898]|uniref:hypothetical protein n=1 Tax=Micromonospora sp. NPDC048898 TaxID=3364260 RepID=UPI00371FF8EA
MSGVPGGARVSTNPLRQLTIDQLRQRTSLKWREYPDCRALGLGDDPAAVFLDGGRVALNSGPAFGTGGDGHVRLNLATAPELITDAVRRMATAVAG